MNHSSEGISEALWQLAEMLKLPSPPVRIEGIDISHTQVRSV
jgi:excinuclease UvrABC nuclease subunit